MNYSVEHKVVIIDNKRKLADDEELVYDVTDKFWKEVQRLQTTQIEGFKKTSSMNTLDISVKAGRKGDCEAPEGDIAYNICTIALRRRADAIKSRVYIALSAVLQQAVEWSYI